MEKISKNVRIIHSLIIVILLIALVTARPEEASAAKHISESQHGESLKVDAALAPANSIAVNNNTIQSTVALACGGMINLPFVGSYVVVDYKTTVSYANNEKCIWTFNNRIGSYRVKPSLRITMLLDGFERGPDALKVLYWTKGNSELSAVTLATSVASTINSEAIFLSFHSDGSVQGTGFIARIDLISTSQISTYGYNYFYSSSSTRTKTYGTYGNHDVGSIVVNPSSPTISLFTFSITALGTETSANSACPYDFLEVYEIINGISSKRAKLCGVNSLVASSFRTNYPVIAVFASDGSNTGTGFTVTW